MFTQFEPHLVVPDGHTQVVPLQNRGDAHVSGHVTLPLHPSPAVPQAWPAQVWAEVFGVHWQVPGDPEAEHMNGAVQPAPHDSVVHPSVASDPH